MVAREHEGHLPALALTGLAGGAWGGGSAAQWVRRRMEDLL